MPAAARTVTVRLTAQTADFIRQMQQAGQLGADAMQDVQAQSRAASGALGDLTGSANEAQAASAATSAALDDLADSAGKVGAGAAVGVGLLSKAAIDWESQWAGVTKTVDGSVSQLGELEGGLRELARTMPATHEEIAATAEAAGQLGVARDDVVDFTQTMIMLGETTNLTADAAATSVAQMTNVMKTAPQDVDNLGAALVALGNDGASTEAQILDMAQRISGAGSIIGLSESEILGIANAMASVGIEAEAGGTSVSRILTEMAKAASTGSGELELMAGVAGQTAEQFGQMIKMDPAQAFVAFTQGLDRVASSGGDVFTLLDQIGLSDVRVSQALLGMAGSGDMLTKSLELGASAWAENTALMDEYAKRADTTESKMTVAMNNIRDAAIELGEVALPVIGEAAEMVVDFGGAVGALPDPMQSALTSALAMTAVIGGGIWVGRRAYSTFNDTRDSLRQLAPQYDRARAGVASYSQSIVGLNRNFREMRSVSRADRLAAPGVGFIGPITQTQVAAQNAAIAANNLRTGLANVAKTAAGIGAVAVATTGAAEGLGLQNTAMLGLMGIMFGPWGAAIGAGVGAVVDFTQANRDASAAVGELDKAMDGNSYAAVATGLDQIRGKIDATEESSGRVTKALSFIPVVGAYASMGFDKLFGGGRRRMEDEAAQAKSAIEGYEQLAIAIGATNTALDDTFRDTPFGGALATAGWLDDTKVSATELEQAVLRVQPALEQMGITANDIAGMAGSELNALTADVVEWVENTGSAEGRAENLGAAVADMGGDMQSAADDAKELSKALSGLMDPGLNVSQLRDDWDRAISGIREAMNAKGVDDFDRRDILRENLQLAQELAVAEVEHNPAGAASIIGYLKERRDQLVAAAEAAGMADDQIQSIVYGWAGLSDENIELAIGTAARDAQGAVEDTSGAVNQLNEDVQGLAGATSLLPMIDLDVAAPGVPEVEGQILGLTDGLLNLAANPWNANVGVPGATSAEGDVAGLTRSLSGMTSRPWTATLGAQDRLSPVVASARAALASIDRSVTVRITGVMSGFSNLASRSFSAAGNLFRAGAPAVSAYAAGGMDLPNAHQPELTRPGAPLRIWSEPETRGEAYIPLANDWRRPRAVDIWRQTGRELGVLHFARGGVSAAQQRKNAVRGAINAFAPEYREDTRDPRMKALGDEINTLRWALRDAGVAFSSAATKAAGALQVTSSRLFTLQDSTAALRDAQKGLISEATGRFRNDLWGNGVAGARTQLEADINDARTARAAQAQLGKKGVSVGLLEGLYASGDINSMTQLAGMTKAQIAEMNQLYATRQSVSSAVGGIAAQQVYGAQIAKQDKLIAQLTKTLTGLEKRVENAAYKGYVDGARTVSSGTGARRKG